MAAQKKNSFKTVVNPSPPSVIEIVAPARGSGLEPASVRSPTNSSGRCKKTIYFDNLHGNNFISGTLDVAVILLHEAVYDSEDPLSLLNHHEYRGSVLRKLL